MSCGISTRPWRTKQVDSTNCLKILSAEGYEVGLAARSMDGTLIVDAVNEHDRLCGIVLALCDEVEAMDDSDAVVLTDRAARIQNLIAEAREILGAGETPKGKGVGV